MTSWKLGLGWVKLAQDAIQWRLLWTRWCTFGFHKMWGNSWADDLLPASQGLCSMKLISYTSSMLSFSLFNLTFYFIHKYIHGLFLLSWHLKVYLKRDCGPGAWEFTSASSALERAGQKPLVPMDPVMAARNQFRILIFMLYKKSSFERNLRSMAFLSHFFPIQRTFKKFFLVYSSTANLKQFFLLNFSGNSQASDKRSNLGVLRHITLTSTYMFYRNEMQPVITFCPVGRLKSSWTDQLTRHSLSSSFWPQKLITEMEHLSCSPYLAPNDFWLFSKIKSSLKGRIFQDTEDIKKKIQICITAAHCRQSTNFSNGPRSWSAILKRVLLKWP
jgi:hypothetical protein